METNNENRNQYIIFRVTEHEKDLLKQDADKEGLNVSELVRSKLGFED